MRQWLCTQVAPGFLCDLLLGGSISRTYQAKKKKKKCDHHARPITILAILTSQIVFVIIFMNIAIFSDAVMTLDCTNSKDLSFEHFNSPKALSLCVFCTLWNSHGG